MSRRAAIRTLVALVSLFALALLGVVTFHYQRDLQAAHQHVGVGSELLQTACGPIEVATVGQDAPILGGHLWVGRHQRVLEEIAAFVLD